MENKMSPEAEKRKAKFEHEWIGKDVLIVGNHPHSKKTGTIKSFDYTGAGWGLMVELTEGGGCYVYHKENLQVI